MAVTKIPDYLKKSAKDYGQIIKSGTEVLKEKSSYEIISVGPAIDIALGGGIKEGSWVTLTGDPKSGKDQPLTSTVYTPDGPKTMGSLKIGDLVCTPDGDFAKINGIYPQGLKDVYRVTFNDGTFAECGIDHLWKVCKNYHGRNDEWVVLPLRQIIEEGLFYSDRAKWKIPICEPVYFGCKNLEIDPYILGCLIGDGGLSQGTPIITTSDNEILEAFKYYAKNNGLEIHHRSRYDYSIVGYEKNVNNLTNKLRTLNLMGKNSHTKFIPQNYLYSSINDRFELIRGLMDTDGYNDNGKSAEYSTVSYLLSIHVAELLRSLGYMVKTKERMTKCNGQEFKSFRLYISGNDVNKLFKLSRKIFYSKRKKPKLFKTIKKVEVVRKEETQCIFINHQDHLYLTDSFNVTHNTTTAMQIAANCQKLGRNIIYIDAEGRFKDMNFQVDGLDPEKMLIMAPEDKPIPAEKFLEWAYMMMSHSDNYGAVLIIDSISSLIPEKELDGDFTAGRAGLPKVLSVFTKKVGQLLPRQRGLVIAITHYIANTSGFGKAKMADGGNKIQYQADTRMEIAGGGENTPAVKFWEDDEGKRVGQVVNWKIICSSMGPPGGQVQSYIKYGHGIDRTQEILMLALDLGLIDKSGAWFTCSFIQLYKDLAKQIFPDINVENQEELFSVKGFKFQGQNKLYDFLKSHPVLVDTLEKMIKENLT